VDRFELAILALGSLALCAAVFVLTRVAAAGLRRAVVYFLEPVRPPSLIRLSSTVARYLEERQAAELARQRREVPPLPEIVLAFRAFTARARGGPVEGRPSH
jgi:hypothetical protein